jgi:hypothetical protein
MRGKKASQIGFSNVIHNFLEIRAFALTLDCYPKEIRHSSYALSSLALQVTVFATQANSGGDLGQQKSRFVPVRFGYHRRFAGDRRG